VLNSGVTELNITKILHDVEALVALLNRAYARQYGISFLNARAKSEGSYFLRLQKASKLNWLP